MKKLFRTHEANVRQPRFELHLKIYDLNNVPLVAGWSLIKWHIVHSIHAEHRGATERRAIANHRVHYSYSKLVGNVRIPIDKSLRLSECWLELEVLQEYSSGGLRDEKVPLGKVRVNLGEFVEESMNMDIQLLSRRRPAAMASSAAGSSLSSQYDVQDGIIRRYLLQDSKINSTLKIGVLMVQVDGDRNYSAPPLKTAPVFGGLAGVFVGEAPDQEDGNKVPMIASNKARDVAEVDLYRSMLIASWNCPLDELRADEAIEDIFHQGDSKHSPYSPHVHSHGHTHRHTPSSLPTLTASSSAKRFAHSHYSSTYGRDESGSGDENYASISHNYGHGHGHRSGGKSHRDHRHHRTSSGLSETSAATVTRSGYSGNRAPTQDRITHRPLAGTPSVHRRNISRSSNEYLTLGARSRSSSFTSLASMDGSGDDYSRDTDAHDIELRHISGREVREHEIRENMVAWTVPTQQTA
ncbi:hypothetical protein Cpir12675_000843 [Ceratocystis pirilliformis]|uniref:C2 NT-type domain-containing protein n=1 Tax=Ceratocystis pirilliformis TaxID=259994 RepID=A0ABR3ZMI3_9PEZI